MSGLRRPLPSNQQYCLWIHPQSWTTQILRQLAIESRVCVRVCVRARVPVGRAPSPIAHGQGTGDFLCRLLDFNLSFLSFLCSFLPRGPAACRSSSFVLVVQQPAATFDPPSLEPASSWRVCKGTWSPTRPRRGSLDSAWNCASHPAHLPERYQQRSVSSIKISRTWLECSRGPRGPGDRKPADQLMPKGRNNPDPLQPRLPEECSSRKQRPTILSFRLMA